MRDLLVGVRRFNELARGLPGMSRGLLSKRLDQLERDGLVVHENGEYRPTDACEGLRPLMFGLAEWGARWAFGEPRPDELNATVLMWWIRARMDAGPFRRDRVVIQLLLPDGKPQRFWLVVEPDDVPLCFTDPGYEVDLVITSPLGLLYQVWEGRVSQAAAQRSGALRVTGERALVRALPAALRFSPVAPYVRRAAKVR